jgi:hypothetical protein
MFALFSQALSGREKFIQSVRLNAGSELPMKPSEQMSPMATLDFTPSLPNRDSVTSAARFCRVFDEVRQFFRVRTTMKQQVCLAHQREVFRQRLEALSAMVLVS